MASDLRDLAIQATCPVVSMPRFGELGEQPMGQRMVVGRNGLFVQMRTPWLACTTRVGEVGMPLPFGDVREAIRFTFGVIPRALLEAFIKQARSSLPNEVAGALIFDTSTSRLRLSMHRALDAGPGHVTYEIGAMVDQEVLAIDLHSHGRLGAFWSGQDDLDDQGVRVCGVFGHLDRDRPSARFRLVVNGVFRDLPHPWSDEEDEAGCALSNATTHKHIGASSAHLPSPGRNDRAREARSSFWASAAGTEPVHVRVRPLTALMVAFVNQTLAVVIDWIDGVMRRTGGEKRR